jgi:predicted O-linked N-acetylglucosamine transferase (SPINDLY family)
MPLQRVIDAVSCWQSGRQTDAEALCRAAIQDDPADADAHRLLAEILTASSRRDEAIRACRQVAELAPRDASNLRRLAQLLSQAGEHLCAVTQLELSLKIEPDNPRALNNLGNLLVGLGRPADAIPLLERAIAVQPAYPIAQNNLGTALSRSGRLDEAIACYERALALNGRFPEALINLASALTATGRLDEALGCYERAEQLQSPGPEVLIARAELLLKLKRASEALAAFDRALGSAPQLPAARLGRIHALLSLDRPEVALAACDEMLAAAPATPGVRGLRAHALLKLKRTREALLVATEATLNDAGDAQAFVALGFAAIAVGRASRALAAFDQALLLHPTLAKAYAGRGLALAAAGQGSAAIAAYEQAAQLDPRDANVFMEVGQLMLRLGRFGNAHAAFCAALELRPDDVAAQEGRVATLTSLNRYEEALPGLAALRASAPSLDYLPGLELFAQLHCCEWSGLDAASRDITERIRRGERADTPLSFIAHNDSPADQLLCAQIYVADRCSIRPPATRQFERASRPRLRVAYLSADLRNHPVGQLLAGVFESHDRSRFETYALSAGLDDGSTLRQRLEHSFDHFIDVSEMQDAALAARMAELSIDIAVDLGGHTTGSRTRVLAYRPAPIQVSFLGFPGTLGADFIDYIIADRHVIPEAHRSHYSEQVIYLPDCYLPNDFAAQVNSPPSRPEAGLPATGFVYCSFNAPYKLSPSMFDLWMRILKEVPDGVLWLRETSSTARQNLAKEAGRRGIDPARILYAPIMRAHAEHHARLALADVFLDTHLYNAHTTASDALRAGVPVITTPGRSFASRVATSLLHAVELGHLSVQSPDDYVQLAIALARTPSALAELRAHLRRVHASAPLFDTARFCRHLEAAYSEIGARFKRGEKPSALWVERGACSSPWASVRADVMSR